MKIKLRIVQNEELIPGGKGTSLKGNKQDKIEQVAKMYNTSSEVISKELELGIEEEMEHASDERYAEEIAFDHLVEDPKYYTKLKNL